MADLHRLRLSDVSVRFSVTNVDGKPLERPLMPAVYEKEELSQLGSEYKVSHVEIYGGDRHG